MIEWKNSIINYLMLAGLALAGLALVYSTLWGLSLLFACSLIFVIAFIACLVFYNLNGLQAEIKFEVVFDQYTISCKTKNKPAEIVRWLDISSIVIVTTDKGPHEPYIWILLQSDSGKGCMFPLGAKNSQIVVEKILGFPGLNLELWAKGMKETSNNRFLIWQREGRLV